MRVYVPSFGAAAMQVFPVSPLDVATMSAAVNAATKAMARKIFLIIVVGPCACRAQLRVGFLVFVINVVNGHASCKSVIRPTL